MFKIEYATKKWPRQAGRKPSKTHLKDASSVARPGTKDAIAVAMAIRDMGTTQKQIASVLGAPHRNKIRKLLSTGKAKRVMMPSQDGHMVYKIVLKK